MRFLDIAHGSAREVEYQLTVALRLGFLSNESPLMTQSVEVSKTLNALIRSLAP